MNKLFDSSIEKEKDILYKMIKIYCRGNHNIRKENICDECSMLYQYAANRLDKCKYQNKKHTCKLCPIHCYKLEYKEKIRLVMRYSGPRMIFYHPYDALKHLLKEKF